MSSSLGGVSIPDPDSPFTMESIAVGAQDIALDGGLLTDLIAERFLITLNFSLMTDAQRGTLYTRYMVATTQTLITDAYSNSGKIKRGTWTQSPRANGSGVLYDISFKFQTTA